MNLWACFLVAVFGSFSVGVSPQRQSCPALTLKNGRVRIRGGGRMAYFRCKKKFKRVGHKLAVCLSSGTWSQQTPVCVGRGCPDLGALPDVTVKEMYKGGILQFTCPEGMRREGPQTLMCDGTNWDKLPPKCLYGASLGCDFEDSGLCGWSQDTNDDFDWTWTSGFTPTTETGPDGDHTTGSGHYIFMESSAPQKFGQVTRLISPPYQPPPEPMCIEFFYHMLGPPKDLEVGDLDVFIRTGSQGEDPVDVAVFHRAGYQADDWVRGVVSIPPQTGIFKIVFAATRRQGWSGDIALDDVKVFNCSDMPDNTTSTITTPALTTTTTTTTTAATMPATTTTTTTTSTTTTPTPTTTTTQKTTTTAQPTTTTTTPTTTTTTTPTTSSTTTTTPTTSSTTSTTTPSTTTMTTTTSSTSITSSTPFTTSSMSSSTSTSTESTSTQSSTSSSSSSTTSSTTTMRTSSPGASSTTWDYFRSTSSSSPSSSMSSKTAFHDVSSKSTTIPGDGIAKDASNETITTSFMSTGSSNISSSSSNDDDEDEEGDGKPGGRRSSGEGSAGVSDYLPLIVGVSLGLVVGMAVVGILAWLWARNRRKQKEIQIEEDQLNIIGSIDGASYSYPPSGSEH